MPRPDPRSAFFEGVRRAVNSARGSDGYARNPVGWVHEVLKEPTWSRQREILESVRDNRRTAVQSCHGSGKSWTAARVVAWWLSCHPVGSARAVTSAPSAPQVRAILWHEIARAHAAGNLPGRLNQTEWWASIDGEREELLAFGRKPAANAPDAFQGIHEKYVLVVFDEATGIPQSLWDAAEGLLSNEHCRLLTIGNPTDPHTAFGAECKPGSGANVIKISAFDTPNFTGEDVNEELRDRLVGQVWVDEKRRKWGEDNPLYVAKILGEFPEYSEDSLIPASWVRAAQERDLPTGLPVELGVDVGAGGDKSVIACRRGGRVRILRRDRNPDTMQTCGNVVAALRETGASVAKVDMIGIGKGVVDRGIEQGKPFEGINVGQPASDRDSFANYRAEVYWGLRERFQAGEVDIDPHDDDLVSQLVDLRFKRTSTGKIQIESKDEMRRRGRASPDDADAVALAFAVPPPPEYPEPEVW